MLLASSAVFSYGFFAIGFPRENGGEKMSVRYDFECTAGHAFTLWSDDARMCPTCGSEFLKRVFLTAPAVNSGKSQFVDNLLKRELDARGITNVKSSGREGDSASVTYKSTPEDLASEMVTKAFPQMDEKSMNNKNGIQQVMQKVTANWAQVDEKSMNNKNGIQQVMQKVTAN